MSDFLITPPLFRWTVNQKVRVSPKLNVLHINRFLDHKKLETSELQSKWLTNRKFRKISYTFSFLKHVLKRTFTNKTLTIPRFTNSKIGLDSDNFYSDKRIDFSFVFHKLICAKREFMFYKRNCSKIQIHNPVLYWWQGVRLRNIGVQK